MCLPRDEGGIITYCRLIARDVSSSKFFSVFLSLLRPSLLGNARLMGVEPVAKTKTSISYEFVYVLGRIHHTFKQTLRGTLRNMFSGLWIMVCKDYF